MVPGVLYLVPAGLAESPWQRTVPPEVRGVADRLDYFIVENAKTARAELKRLEASRAIRDIEIRTLPETPTAAELDALLDPLDAGRSAGLMSEAGCPAVADPGAQLVQRAHERGLPVAPLVGPSALLLALMASGLNGQSFAFHGYLPVADAEREKRLRELEAESRRERRTQMFIETPYRNGRMLQSLLRVLSPATRLCMAAGLTGPRERIVSRPVGEWRRGTLPDPGKEPTVFLFLAQ